MARKPVSPAGEVAPADPRRRAVEALLTLAATQRWDDIELDAVAREAGVPLVELRRLFPSKLAMLGALARIADDAVLGTPASDLAGEPVRERLFDLVMRRLDALAPYKPGLKRALPALRRDPLSLAAFNRSAIASWRYMFASAGIPTEDALGALRLQGMVLLMARVIEVWLEDEEPELSKTMAALDRELKRAGRAMARIEDLHRLTAPLRGFARAICGGPRRIRRRERRETDRRGEESDDYAPAI